MPHLTFTVMTCHYAALLLSNTRSGEYKYEVIIGYDRNRLVVVRDADGRIHHTIDRPDLLSCNEYRKFWITFTTGSIAVGTGSDFNNVFLNWVTPQAITVSAVGLTTGEDSVGEWLFDLSAAHQVQSMPPPLYTYDTMVVTVLQHNYIIFSVQACNDASIALSFLPDVTDYRTYEVVIGTETNTKSVVKNGKKGAVITEASTINILNCNALNTFWIRWVKTSLEVGRGINIGESLFLTAFQATSFDISSAAFTTADNVQGLWQITEVRGGRYTVEAEAGSSYAQNMWVTPAHHWIAFDIMACHEVYIALTWTAGTIDHNTREIALGVNNNRVIEIRDANTGAVKESTTMTNPVLYCNATRTYCVGWEDSVLTVTDGPNPTYRPLVSWTDITHAPVFSIGIKMGSAKGVIEFDQSMGTGIEITTQTGRQFKKFWVTTTGITAAVFELKADKSAYIALSAVEGQVDIDMIEVQLGIDNNMRSSIRPTPNGDTDVVTVDTPSILDSLQFRAFWVSWANGHIRVGKGGNVYINEFISYPDPTPQKVGAVGFAADSTADSAWVITKLLGNGYNIFTKSSQLDYKRAWVAMGDHTQFVFRVKACTDVHVLLSHTFDHYDPMNTYEVVLGGWYNTKSVIRTENVEQVYMNTFELLDCDEFRHFWIRWYGGHIEVGSGEIVGMDLFMSWRDETPIENIRHVSLSTGYDNSGEYEISQNQGTHVTFLTPANYSFSYVWVTLVGDSSFVFRLKACSEAYIALTKVPYNIITLSYEVALGVRGNTECELRHHTGPAEVKHTATIAALDCNEYKDFWIDWDRGRVRCGHGSAVGQNVFLDWTDSEPHDVNTIGLASGTDAYWEIMHPHVSGQTTTTSSTLPTASTTTTTGSGSTTTTNLLPTESTTLNGPLPPSSDSGGMTPQGIAGLVVGIVLLLGIAGAIGGFLYVRRRNQMLYGKMADEQPIHYDNPVYSEGVFGSGIKDLHSAPASSGAGNLGN